MTTLTINTNQLLAIEVGVLVLAGLIAVLLAFGVLRFSVSIGAIPPWNRKPAAKKNPDAAVPAAAGEAPAGTAVKPVRKVS